MDEGALQHGSATRQPVQVSRPGGSGGRGQHQSRRQQPRPALFSHAQTVPIQRNSGEATTDFTGERSTPRRTPGNSNRVVPKPAPLSQPWRLPDVQTPSHGLGTRKGRRLRTALSRFPGSLLVRSQWAWCAESDDASVKVHDVVTVELIQPDGKGAFIQVTWPARPTRIDPAGFRDTASAMVRLFSEAHVKLARIKARRRL